MSKQFRNNNTKINKKIINKNKDNEENNKKYKIFSDFCLADDMENVKIFLSKDTNKK